MWGHARHWSGPQSPIEFASQVKKSAFAEPGARFGAYSPHPISGGGCLEMLVESGRDSAFKPVATTKK